MNGNLDALKNGFLKDAPTGGFQVLFLLRGKPLPPLLGNSIWEGVFPSFGKDKRECNVERRSQGLGRRFPKCEAMDSQGFEITQNY